MITQAVPVSFVLLVLLLMPLVVSLLVWARLDARRGDCRPVSRPITVAAICVITYFSFILLLISRDQAGAGGGQVNFSVVAMLIAFSVIFTSAAGLGMFVYLSMYAICAKGTVPHSSGEDDAKSRIEETGNPYQPPSS